MMKHLLFPVLIALPTFVFGQTVLISEDFDSYANGNPLAQTAGLPWSTWSDDPGSSEDTNISNEQANSGTLSVKFSGAPAGGPSDMALRLGDRTSGVYALSWNMYVTEGSGAYFNLQHNEVIGAGSWMMEAVFLPNGSVQFPPATAILPQVYPSGEWFALSLLIDLDQQQGSMSVNGTVHHTWSTSAPGPNRLGSLNIFAYAGGAPNVPNYYFDDILFVDVTGVGINETSRAGIAVYPNPTSDLLNVELDASMTDAIISVLDLSGRTVIEGQTTSANLGQVDLSPLPAGVYVLRVQNSEQELVQRVTKF